jgi:hypothetical protein
VPCPARQRKLDGYVGEGSHEIVSVFCGIDWAEDHVRHEALEVERG